MKVLLISDIHGSSYYAKKIEEIVNREEPNKIIVLGDLYYHGPRNPLTQEYNPSEVAKILNSLKDRLEVIKGNCDAEVDEMISEFQFNKNLLEEINGKKFFFTHGHIYNIDNLPKEDFDIMCYGHFHTHFIKQEQGKIFVNPGSISLPKENTKHSYAIIAEEEIQIKDVEGNLVESLKYKDIM